MMADTAARDRIRRLVAAARRVVHPEDPLRAVARLTASTGLSSEGVRWALGSCLEVDPGEDQIESLLGRVPRAPAAHVLLSSNVFVAAHRALALALGSAERVFVRPSRREPEMVALLREAAGAGLFEVVERLTPRAGDVVYAYGSDETLRTLSWPSGVRIRSHGSGLGAAVCSFSEPGDAELNEVADRLVTDIALFDQRGCLSPRVCVVQATAPVIQRFASAVRDGLERIEARIPRGRLEPAELADARRHADTWTYAGAYLEASAGGVSVDLDANTITLSPVGRFMHCVRSDDACASLGPLRTALTTIGVHGDPDLRGRIGGAFPDARIARVGSMQRPPLDGPVDLRRDAVASGAGI